MALLQRRNSSAPIAIPCRCLVGRSTLADLRLKSRRASNEHAAIGWYSGQWVLRDLGSSNGTLVNGRPVPARERVFVSVGSTIQFGSEDDLFEVVDVTAPGPCAVRLGPQSYVWGTRSLLLLPDEQSPEASIFFEEGSWRVDDNKGVLQPETGDILQLPSGYFRLHLPDEPGLGGATAAYQLDLSQLELVFRVSSDAVVVHLVQGKHDVRLAARACLQTLLVLAQLRQDGSSNPDGWISSGDLAEKRSCSPEKINVDIHRLRKLLEEAGVYDAARIVERDDTKRLRIGVQRTRIVRS
jgi:pSer/pThr/pTyr-binding forkhead associated (FHA) protein